MLSRLRLILGLTAGPVALTVGLALVVSQSELDQYVTDGVVLVQDGADAECTDSTDPRCFVTDDEEDDQEGESGGPDNDGGDGDGSGCYFDGPSGDDGDDYQWASATGSERPQAVYVAQTGVEVPCRIDAWGFYLDACYWGDPPSIAQRPAPPDGKVEGEDGMTLWGDCLASVSGTLPDQTYTLLALMAWRWFDFGDLPEVTPEQVAQNWLATVELDQLELQLAPPETGAGVVNLPVWLGIDETEMSTGPLTDEECLDGVCVSITAEVTEVTWDMGDGTTLTCARADHHIWDPSQDFRSPTGCHHYYERASRHLPGGTYEVTATSHWAVVWQSQVSDAQGELATEVTTPVALQIDEIQVLTN